MGYVDKRTALLIIRASPAERFAMFAGMCKFRAFGLSATMGRQAEFQKMMALVQMVGQSPLFLQAFMKKFSPDRALEYLIRLINVNPENFQKTQDELDMEAQQQEAQRAQGAAQIAGGGQGGAPPGGASVPAQANQMANPLTGLTANG